MIDKIEITSPIAYETEATGEILRYNKTQDPEERQLLACELCECCIDGVENMNTEWTNGVPSRYLDRNIFLSMVGIVHKEVDILLKDTDYYNRMVDTICSTFGTEDVLKADYYIDNLRNFLILTDPKNSEQERIYGFCSFVISMIEARILVLEAQNEDSINNVEIERFKENSAKWRVYRSVACPQFSYFLRTVGSYANRGEFTF